MLSPLLTCDSLSPRGQGVMLAPVTGEQRASPARVCVGKRATGALQELAAGSGRCRWTSQSIRGLSWLGASLCRQKGGQRGVCCTCLGQLDQVLRGVRLCMQTASRCLLCTLMFSVVTARRNLHVLIPLCLSCIQADVYMLESAAVVEHKGRDVECCKGSAGDGVKKTQTL